MGVSVRKKNKSSDDWWVFVRHQGKRKSIKVGSKKAAEATAETIRHTLAEKKLGIFEESENKKINFNGYAQSWLDNYIKQFKSAGTYTRYNGLLKHKIKKHIGQADIRDITRGDVRDLLMAEYKKGASKSSLGIMLCVISGAMRHAMDDELIISNPAQGISVQFGINQGKKEKIEPLSAEETTIVLNVIKESCPDYYPFFLTAFRTGCRLGELCALQWKDIDFGARSILIRRTAKDQHVKESTKTYHRRHIDMTNHLYDTLKAHSGAVEKDDLWVFHKKGKLLSQQTIRRTWEKALETAEIKRRRLHDIRHSFASQLLANNAPVVYVSNQLGHSNPHITLTVYAHYIPSTDNDIINVLDG